MRRNDDANAIADRTLKRLGKDYFCEGQMSIFDVDWEAVRNAKSKAYEEEAVHCASHDAGMGMDF